MGSEHLIKELARPPIILRNKEKAKQMQGIKGKDCTYVKGFIGKKDT